MSLNVVVVVVVVAEHTAAFLFESATSDPAPDRLVFRFRLLFGRKPFNVPRITTVRRRAKKTVGVASVMS